MRNLPRAVWWLLLIGALPLAGEAPFALDLSPKRARSFDDDSPIRIDVDRDGRTDTLQPRILRLRRRFIPGARRYPGGDVERFIAFSLETASGRSIATLLQYRFGTENGGYRSYVLGPVGDADGDGRGDLAFHVGGGLPEEAVVLLDRGERFEPRSTGPLLCACRVTEDLRIVARDRGSEDRVLGEWHRPAARFVGDGIVWVTGGEALVRARASEAAKVLETITGGSGIRLLDLEPPAARVPGWAAVAIEGVAGWIEESAVASRSPIAPMPTGR